MYQALGLLFVACQCNYLLLFHMLALKSQELFRGHPFMTSIQKGGEGGWGGRVFFEISQILLSLNNKPIACFCR